MSRRKNLLVALVVATCFAAGVLYLLPPDNSATSAAIDHDSTAILSGQSIDFATLPILAEAGPIDNIARRTVQKADEQITGRIIDHQGPLADVQVELLHADEKRRMHSAWKGSTNDAGRFAASGLPANRYRLAVQGPNVPNGLEVNWFELQAGQSFDLGDLRVPLPGSLHGRIVDPSGKPMPGVRVYHHHSTNHLRRNFNLDAEPDSEAADPNQLTDADGNYAFTNLPPGEHSIRAEVKGFAAGKLECVLQEGIDKQNPDLQMNRGRRISGRVFAADGSSIADAVVMPVEMADRPAPRRATRSQADGSFSLEGLGDLESVELRASGYAHTRVPWGDLQNDAGPVLVQLSREISLHGQIVDFTGGAGSVELEPADIHLDMSPSVQAKCWVQHPVRADGSFTIDGLVEGDYAITATAEGVGQSEKTTVRLQPGMEPLSLKIRGLGTIEVIVRDELGQPLPDTEVFVYLRRWFMTEEHSWPVDKHDIENTIRYSKRDHGQHVVTDSNGSALLRESTESMSIAATLPGYLSTGMSFDNARMPKRIELVMAKSASLSGRLNDVRDRKVFGLQVVASPLPGQGPALPEKAILDSVVDGQGRYSFPLLRPGKYEIAVRRQDMSWSDQVFQQADVRRPILGVGIDSRTAAQVELSPGEETVLDLTLAPLGKISGRVLQQGEPAAGMLVFADVTRYPDVARNRAYFGNQDSDTKDSYQFRPHTRSDANGSYEFNYVEPGTWTLLAQHPDSTMPGSPITIRAADYALQLEQDLHIATGELRGQIDFQKVPETRRKFLEVLLTRMELATHDPFLNGSRSSRMESAEIDENGRFTFPFLREGDWILRVVDRFDDLILQIPVHSTPNQVVELGLLAPLATVELELDVDLPTSERDAGFWIRRIYASVNGHVYANTAFVEEGKAKLTSIEPGDYEAELFWAYEPTLHSRRLNGKSPGLFARFTIHADGSATPEKLVFK